MSQVSQVSQLSLVSNVTNSMKEKTSLFYKASSSYPVVILCEQKGAKNECDG
jgi:hypothetical protein